MPPLVRLLALPASDPQTVRFCLDFAAPGESDRPLAAEAWLETGEGPALQLGVVCSPGAATWREQHMVDLLSFSYHGTGPYAARLLWGEMLAEATAQPGVGQSPVHLPETGEAVPPQLVSFAIEGAEGRSMEQTARWVVRGLSAGYSLRLDGGAGQVCRMPATGAAEQAGEYRLAYAKPGAYTVSLDLLNQEGFWLRRLSEYPVEVAPWNEEIESGRGAAEAADLAAYVPVADRPPGAGKEAERPWIRFRYAQPLWGWLRTYTNPGGGAVARVLALGTYLSLRVETMVGDTLWYQTAGKDWIPGGALEMMHPSDLRGVEPHAPTRADPVEAAKRHGIVVADRLNVRARPGVWAGNPPIGQLASGSSVVIDDETVSSGKYWFCIGPGRWVHGDHIRVLQPTPVRRTPTVDNVVELPVGWVVAPSLNVRSRPGVGQDNPPIDVLAHNQMVEILDTCTIGGTLWYCIGDRRWVEGAWLAVARTTPRPRNIGTEEQWVAVSLADQTLVAYCEDRPVYAAMIASGLPATPTVAGLFHVYRRAEVGRMAGRSPARGSSYCLEDVPWISYFHGAYALHGAYWHDSFGRPRSHGCVNMSVYDAWWLFRWSADTKLAVFIY